MVEKPRTADEAKARARKKPPARAKAPQVRYGAKIAADICERLAKGEPWSSICAFEGMPSYTTLYAWQDKDPAFAEAVARARLQGADACADEALTVARAATKETAPQARLLVSTLMRRAALIAPKAWGGKAEKEARQTPERVEIVFRARRFEKVIGPDGRAFVRELKPEGEA
ncbi:MULTISPECIES: hypothetical protein [unclassified Phenylobacterium]|uniref:terminase small subunit-like protein n=1 Tax=unclassified Phenylobacterium TaxID=2640670 RepID=UPI00083ACCEB|nr:MULTISPECIES: hypothetical protein [unclassified Phenylobacterium]